MQNNHQEYSPELSKPVTRRTEMTIQDYY